MTERKINPDLPGVKESWAGNYYRNGRFYNNNVVKRPPLSKVLKWKFSKNPQKLEKRNDQYSLKVKNPAPFSNKSDGVTWLGHLTFLISVNGINIITDPVLYDIPTSKRLVKLPLSDKSFYPVDYILVSHDHRDHFDKKSMKKIKVLNPQVEVLMPLGAERLFSSRKMKGIKRQEAGWFQEYIINEDVQIIFLPSNHWGRRGLFDFNKTLWGSFLIVTDTIKIYFGGDTAYGDHFSEIHELFGDIDVCILPIGAYSPAWLMSESHMSPKEAAKAFLDLGGIYFIPGHYGTFDLTDEPLSEPILRLEKELDFLGRLHSLKELSVGGFFQF
ncbi:MAG: MBL fold metallo-hydrolase [Prolixibacteraceae bacterium]|nr:MBL fold metallo-hydrolase [Prolixibacteraceae bacterium]